MYDTADSFTTIHAIYYLLQSSMSPILSLPARKIKTGQGLLQNESVCENSPIFEHFFYRARSSLTPLFHRAEPFILIVHVPVVLVLSSDQTGYQQLCSALLPHSSSQTRHKSAPLHNSDCPHSSTDLG